MPAYKKIPAKVRAIGAVASGRYCVFAKGLIAAGPVFVRLAELEKKGAIPCVGVVNVNKKQYYYCLYGFVNDPDIYQ